MPGVFTNTRVHERTFVVLQSLGYSTPGNVDIGHQPLKAGRGLGVESTDGEQEEKVMDEEEEQDGEQEEHGRDCWWWRSAER